MKSFFYQIQDLQWTSHCSRSWGYSREPGGVAALTELTFKWRQTVRQGVSDEQNRGMDKQYSGAGGQGSQETATRVAKHTFGAED